MIRIMKNGEAIHAETFYEYNSLIHKNSLKKINGN